MRRAVVILLVAVAAVLLASQLLLPRYLERRIADRLTDRGGTADVSLQALPALRLLAGDGDRVRVDATGLDVDLTAPHLEVFERLEGFDEVDVRLGDTAAGPFHASSFTLTRVEGSSRYRLALNATVSARDLSRFAASQLAGSLGALFGDLAGSVSPLADTSIPVDLDTGIEEVDGRWQVTNGAGTVAGLPAGPIAEALAAAIVARL